MTSKLLPRSCRIPRVTKSIEDRSGSREKQPVEHNGSGSLTGRSWHVPGRATVLTQAVRRRYALLSAGPGCRGDPGRRVWEYQAHGSGSERYSWVRVCGAADARACRFGDRLRPASVVVRNPVRECGGWCGHRAVGPLRADTDSGRLADRTISRRETAEAKQSWWAAVLATTPSSWPASDSRRPLSTSPQRLSRWPADVTYALTSTIKRRTCWLCRTPG